MSFIEQLLEGWEEEWRPLGNVAELKRETSETRFQNNTLIINISYKLTL